MWNIVSRNSVRLNMYACAALEAEESWTAGDNGANSKDGESAAVAAKSSHVANHRVGAPYGHPRIEPPKGPRSDGQLSRSEQAVENCGLGENGEAVEPSCSRSRP